MSDQSQATITVIVAAMNEEEVLEDVVRQTLDHLGTRFADYEVILVDDGSVDRTPEIMDRIAEAHPKLRVIHNPRSCGLGNVYRQGLAEARFEYVMMLCGDGGLPPASLPAIFEKVGTTDIVVPYMLNLPAIKSGPRYVLSRTYTTLLNTVFGLGLQYYNGLPVHRRDLLRSIEIMSTGFAFQAEILIKLIRAGASYVEIGVRGSEGKPSRSALRLRNVISVARTLWMLFRALARVPGMRRPQHDASLTR